MGIIEICESGNSAVCYVEKSGELLSSASTAFFLGCPALARCSCACLRSCAWEMAYKEN